MNELVEVSGVANDEGGESQAKMEAAQAQCVVRIIGSQSKGAESLTDNA